MLNIPHKMNGLSSFTGDRWKFKFASPLDETLAFATTIIATAIVMIIITVMATTFHLILLFTTPSPLDCIWDENFGDRGVLFVFLLIRLRISSSLVCSLISYIPFSFSARESWCIIHMVLPVVSA